MDEYRLEALQNFLHSDEWKANINIFLQANAKSFQTTKTEFSHDSYTIFQDFQEIAEQFIEQTLSEVGISFNEIEETLDTHCTTKIQVGIINFVTLPKHLTDSTRDFRSFYLLST